MGDGIEPDPLEEQPLSHLSSLSLSCFENYLVFHLPTFFGGGGIVWLCFYYSDSFLCYTGIVSFLGAVPLKKKAGSTFP